MISIDFDKKTMELAKNVFAESPKQVKYAASAAINRTTTAVRKKLAGLIVGKYDISSGNVKKAITIKRAGRNVLRGAVGSVGAVLPITSFNLRPNPKRINSSLRTGGRVFKAGPMRVRVLRRQGFIAIPGLFVQQSSRSNYAGPMHRYMKTRYPLRTPYGPSIPQMAGNKEVLEELVPFAEKALNQRFLHEVLYRYGKYGGK
ncbi:MAG: hypothetical protein RSB52_08020 [Acidaminococcaceae bacterium]